MQTKTVANAFSRIDQRIATFRSLVSRALVSWKMSSEDDAWLSAVLARRAGLITTPLLSNYALRRFSSRTFLNLMLKHWRDRPAERRYFFITFIDEVGNTLDRRPEVHIAALKKKINNAVRLTPLQAFVQIEMQAISNYPGPPLGRALLVHAHAIAWTEDVKWIEAPSSTGDAWANKINQSRAWSCQLGVPPVEITEIKSSAAHIADVAAYVSKVPHDVKNRMPDHKSPGGHILMSTTAGYRPDLALRIAEGLSQIKLTDVVFGINDQTGVVAEWRATVNAWHKRRLRRSAIEDTRAEIAARWAALRAASGSKNYAAPYRFLAGTTRPASIHSIADNTASSADDE